MKNKLFLKMLCAIGLCLIVACQSNIMENGEEVIVKDFSLKVTVDKTMTKVGDTVTATFVFKNLSGEDIEAELPGWIAELGGQNTEDILRVNFIRASQNPVLWLSPDKSSKPLPKILIESGAVIERKFKHTLKGSYNLEVYAAAFFITNADMADYNKVSLICKPKIIKVR